MNSKYLILTILLLLTEILIAVFLHDDFIRPFFGDFLAVIFVYSGLRIFSKKTFATAVMSLIIACIIEALQYLKFLELTGLINYKVLAIVLGNSFSWLDILAYFLGFVAVLIAEYFYILRVAFPIKSIKI